MTDGLASQSLKTSNEIRIREEREEEEEKGEAEELFQEKNYLRFM